VSANGSPDVPGGVTVVAMLAIVVGIVELIAGVLWSGRAAFGAGDGPSNAQPA
jgi:hypothetical protein